MVLDAPPLFSFQPAHFFENISKLTGGRSRSVRRLCARNLVFLAQPRSDEIEYNREMKHWRRIGAVGAGLLAFFILAGWFGLWMLSGVELPAGTPTVDPTGELIPRIHSVHLAKTQVGRYEKVEITFELETRAANLQLPYDANPPAGIQPGLGVSVEAEFSADHWRTVHRQPAFYYQDFEHEVRGRREWIYPTDRFWWRVRFSPDRVGAWQFRLVAVDSGGRAESEVFHFTVGESTAPGFIRVAEGDPRYFEFADGTYFPALGYNLNYDQLGWTNPVLDNQANFEIMRRNGIQLVRIWLSQWGIYGAAWNPWNSIDPALHGQAIPYAGLAFEGAYPGSEVSLKLDSAINPCMLLGFMKPAPAVKADTRYRVRLRYRTVGLLSPRQRGRPYGLIAKTGGWLALENGGCADAGTGELVTPYVSTSSGAEWSMLEGSIETSSDENFLPYFYLVLENVSGGDAYIDHVWIEEDLGGGKYGPNIISKPWMAHHLYFDQRASYAFDLVLALAEEEGVYLRPVLLEKNDWLFNRFDDSGEPILFDPGCGAAGPAVNPTRCPGNRWFYGDGRRMTKVRWLQQAWWRYVQARWGYSPNIHSWELLNEGDPADIHHYILADEFGKYMHLWGANSHLVSTSFWHSFPKDQFWANPSAANVDFADIHLYVDEANPLFGDTVQMTQNLSMQIGALQPGGAGKPVIRGEAGLQSATSDAAHPLVLRDLRGVWLHNYLWAQLNPGGLIESYWWVEPHILYRRQGEIVYDHRSQYGNYYRFIKDLPLNNGFYQDVAASASNSRILTIGQKDMQNRRAHLWIRNADHTWMNVITGAVIEPVSGSIRVDGFQSGEAFRVEWWDTWADGDPFWRSEWITADANGSIRLEISNLLTDLAVKIEPEHAPAELKSPIPGGSIRTKGIFSDILVYNNSGNNENMSGDTK